MLLYASISLTHIIISTCTSDLVRQSRSQLYFKRIVNPHLSASLRSSCYSARSLHLKHFLGNIWVKLQLNLIVRKILVHC